MNGHTYDQMLTTTLWQCHLGPIGYASKSRQLDTQLTQTLHNMQTRQALDGNRVLCRSDKTGPIGSSMGQGFRDQAQKLTRISPIAHACSRGASVRCIVIK